MIQKIYEIFTLNGETLQSFGEIEVVDEIDLLNKIVRFGSIKETGVRVVNDLCVGSVGSAVENKLKIFRKYINSTNELRKERKHTFPSCNGVVVLNKSGKSIPVRISVNNGVDPAEEFFKGQAKITSEVPPRSLPL